MKKSTAAILVLILVFGVAAVWLLQTYKLDLIESIVLNAVIQKAPPDFPEIEIRHAFAVSRRDSEGRDSQEFYLQDLLALSQRLEKVQHLSRSEIQSLLADLQKEKKPDR